MRGRSRVPFGFIGGLVAFSLLFGCAYYLLNPKVIVSVSPSKDRVNQVILVEGSTLLKHPDIPNARVPARVVKASFPLRCSVPTTGRRIEGVTRARGVVTFFNYGIKGVTLPQGTVVSTGGGLRFRIKEGLRIPPASPRGVSGQIIGMEPGEASVAVEAVEPGSAWNVGGGAINSIEGPMDRLETSGPERPSWDSNVVVTNPEPFSGGRDKVVSVVSEADPGRALSELERLASRTAAKRLVSRLSTSEKLLYETISRQIGKPFFNREIGERGDRLEVSAPVSAAGFAIREPDLLAIANNSFAAGLSHSEKLEDNSLRICLIRDEKLDENTVGLEVSLEGVVVRGVDPSRVARALLGLRMDEARKVLSGFPGIGHFEIEASGYRDAPERLPIFAHWIRVRVKDGKVR